jgi:hypothetical protein
MVYQNVKSNESTGKEKGSVYVTEGNKMVFEIHLMFAACLDTLCMQQVEQVCGNRLRMSK